MKHVKKWLSVAHPLLFAVFFVLALYSVNVNKVYPSEIIIPLIAAIGSAILVLLLASLLICLIRKLQKPQESSQPYRIWNLKKAAIIASIFIVLFFIFGIIVAITGGKATTGLLLSLVWLVIFFIGAYFVVMTHKDLRKMTVALNIVAITLVIIPATSIVVNETKSAGQYSPVAGVMDINSVDLVIPETLPDIYYIILDRYASANTLKEVYDFDNSEFLNYLSGKGFYVANESRANYTKTRSSLASSLNMDYINYLSEQYGEEYQDLGPIYEIIEDNAVWHLLKSVGYEFAYFGSSWEPTRENMYADFSSSYSQLPDFTKLLLITTIAYPVATTLDLIDDSSTEHYNCALYTFDRIAEMPDNIAPTYAFAHILLPHPPYVFDEDGNFLTAEAASEKSREENYINQLTATNNMVTELIDGLLSSSEVPPIIILQADEGPFPPETDFPSFKWEDASEILLKEKYGILNAYYLPDVAEDVLYPSITPVNSFRLIFNLYFGADFMLLPDKSYAFYGDHPYKFLDVTDEVR